MQRSLASKQASGKITVPRWFNFSTARMQLLGCTLSTRFICSRLSLARTAKSIKAARRFNLSGVKRRAYTQAAKVYRSKLVLLFGSRGGNKIVPGLRTRPVDAEQIAE